MWPFKPKAGTNPQYRTVFLILCAGHLRIAEARPTDIGWIASAWPALDDEWMILLPEGQVKGSKPVIGWMPHTGWPEDVVGQFTTSVLQSLGKKQQ